MKKIIAFIICVLLAFIVGWITALKCNPPLPPTVIEKEVIKYNKITKKVSAECPELECYYTAVPGLDITFLQDDEYQLDASLYSLSADQNLPRFLRTSLLTQQL